MDKVKKVVWGDHCIVICERVEHGLGETAISANEPSAESTTERSPSFAQQAAQLRRQVTTESPPKTP